MSLIDSSVCKHNWRHLGGANFGRYRCDDCGALGYGTSYRGMAMFNKIVPYICQKKPCKKCAVYEDVVKVDWRGVHKERRCIDHLVSHSAKSMFRVPDTISKA